MTDETDVQRCTDAPIARWTMILLKHEGNESEPKIVETAPRAEETPRECATIASSRATPKSTVFTTNAPMSNEARSTRHTVDVVEDFAQDRVICYCIC